MAGIKATFDNAADIIERQIIEAFGDLSEGMMDVIDKMSDDVVTELKKTSPVGERGKYSKGWTKKKADDFKGYNIHNKQYQLTHLLNNGHATVNGGWVNGDGHITKANEDVIRKMAELKARAERGQIK